MSDPVVEKELVALLSKLNSKKQKQVLNYARAISGKKRRGVPGSVLLKFAGTIRPEVLDEMEKVIEEGCEKVDPNEW